MKELLYDIATAISFLMGIAVTVASVIIIYPYWQKNRYLKIHLIVTAISHILLIWLTFAGFRFWIWKEYPGTAAVLCLTAYLLTAIGLVYSRRSRDLERIKGEKT